MLKKKNSNMNELYLGGKIYHCMDFDKEKLALHYDITSKHKTDFVTLINFVRGGDVYWETTLPKTAMSNDIHTKMVTVSGELFF
jgi:hypothetical protein